MKQISFSIIALAVSILSLPSLAQDQEKSLYEIFKSGSSVDVKKALEGENVINSHYSDNEDSESDENENRYTPLEIAAKYNNDVEVLRLLIEAKASIEGSALVAAAENSNPEIIKMLLESKSRAYDSFGTDIYSGKENQYIDTALLVSAKNRNIDVMKVLLEAGASLNAKDKEEKSHLMIAAGWNPNPQMISFLTTKGFSIKDRDSDGKTPLLLASETNTNPEVIQVLLKNGASIKDRCKNGSTALLLASRNNSNPEVISTLIKAGASIKEKDENNSSPLLLASEGNSNPQIIKMLLSAGSSVQEKDTFGYTPLLNAVYNNNNEEVIRELIKAGSSVKERVQNVYGSYSNYIMGKGTKIIECKTGWTPIMIAALKNANPEVIELLAKSGASVNERCSYTVKIPDAATDTMLKMFGVKDILTEDMTPLMLAAMATSNPDVITALLKVGANPKDKNKKGQTAFDLAKKNGSLENTPAYWALQEAQYK